MTITDAQVEAALDAFLGHNLARIREAMRAALEAAAQVAAPTAAPGEYDELLKTLDAWCDPDYAKAAAAIRKLTAERDEWKATAEEINGQIQGLISSTEAAEARAAALEEKP